MLRIRTVCAAAALALTTGACAVAQSAPTISPIVQATVLTAAARGAGLLSAAQASTNAPINLSARLGGMVSPRGAGMVGIDFAIPSLYVGSDWHGRLDADVLIKANFKGATTAVPVTLDLVRYLPQTAGGRGVYYGAGLGAVFGGNTLFDGKLLLGTDLSTRVGAEVDVHFTNKVTLITLFARIHV